MGRDARAFAEANRVDAPFTAILDSAAYRRRLQQEREEPPHGEPPRLLRVFDLGSLQLDADEPRAAAEELV